MTKNCIPTQPSELSLLHEIPMVFLIQSCSTASHTQSAASGLANFKTIGMPADRRPVFIFFPGGIMVASQVRLRNRPLRSKSTIASATVNASKIKSNPSKPGRKVTVNTLNPNPNPISIVAIKSDRALRDTRA